MLSHRSLEKVMRFNAQYGEGEQTFSPRDAMEHRPSPYAPGVLPVQQETQRQLRRVLLPNGNITFIAQDEEIPEGAELQ